MKKLAIAVLMLACLPVIARAHHSLRMIDISAPVWVKGAVVRYRPGAPHALLELDEFLADGTHNRWVMEGPFPGRMARLVELYGGSIETYLKPGDVVELCGFRPRPAYAMQRSYGDVDITVSRFIHAQVIVMPDGRMRSWGPYGKLDNCVRTADASSIWREFLNRDPMAHELWCTGLRYTQTPSVAPRGFVEDVNRGLNRACR